MTVNLINDLPEPLYNRLQLQIPGRPDVELKPFTVSAENASRSGEEFFISPETAEKIKPLVAVVKEALTREEPARLTRQAAENEMFALVRADHPELNNYRFQLFHDSGKVIFLEQV